MKREELMTDHLLESASYRIPALNPEVLLVVLATLVLTWIGFAWNMGICLGLGAACGLSLFSLDFFQGADEDD
ncbi:hypothetical protein [Thermithiobacillus plumbiphilus]|uniref:Uncharacterized protein n=1 Tax=Thermithiobacillus plumbiphilus TaxID=1729899 RepID=A0ABU9D670_9PROT